jgi:trimeric autotransporter adhesin
VKALLAAAVCLVVISSAGVCFAQTQLVSDSFEGGPSGTFLGPNWTGCAYNGGAYNKLVYENNQAGGSGYWGQDCALYTGYGAFPSDQYVTATVVAPTPSSSPQASVQLRANATPFTPEAYIACGWDAQDFAPDYHYRIWSLTPGAPGPVSLWLSSITPATNDVVWCQVLGTTITMQVNGTTVATLTDTSGINNGYPGLYYVDPSSAGPTSTDVIFDNFAAGSGPALVSLAINPTSATATAGSYVQFTGTATYADGTTVNLSNWSSSNTSVATVDSTGFAYGATAGTVTITGGAGGDSGTANLTVLAAQGYTPLVNDSFTGTGGGYLGPNWTGCAYDSGAYSKLVYQNNQAGGSGYWTQDCALYTGYGNTFPSDQYATATVVAPIPSGTPEASIELRANATPSTPESYIACGWDAQDFAADYHYRIWSLPPGGSPTSLYLSPVTPATNDVVWCQVLGTTITMQVNGTTVATVTDASGIINGYPGLYYIDPNGGAPSNNDVIFDNFVAGRIDGPVIASIAVTPGSATVAVGSSVQFTATGTYTDGSTADVSNLVGWSSASGSVATVSAAGLASGVSPGTVTITAASGSASNAASLTVQAIGTPTVTFTGAPASAPYNSTFTVTATTNALVMPTITGTTGVCSVGTVTGSPATASALVTMLTGTGTCTLTANWAGGGGYSAAGPRTQVTTAVKAASITGITSKTPNPSTLQQAVTINFTVGGSGAGPAGAVIVTASTGESCTGTLTSGTGTCSIPFLSTGARTLTASYAGDSNFSSSTSAGVSETVNSPTVSLTPTSINFGKVKQGISLTKAETVSNTGKGALIHFSWSIAGANASEFTVSSTTCGTPPATLNPGAHCVINVTFQPNASGTQTASLKLTDNATNSPQTVGLSGTGQ